MKYNSKNGNDSNNGNDRNSSDDTNSDRNNRRNDSRIAAESVCNVVLLLLYVSR